ncbi:DUF2723 domain-containing protein [Candidatus Gottesmanbacteria bacterium]|nr:DUF2723 domain-containing protein [Candidatus Gottesmanbacteria bacterium]
MRANKIALVLGLFVFSVYLIYQAKGIYTGDSGDLVTAAYGFGVPHPPGYPFYTFIGWLLSHLPFSTVAWRVSLLSSLPHAVSISLVFLLLYYLTRSYAAALIGAVFLFGNYLVFLYSVTPEVFALFDFFVICIIFLIVRFRQTKKRYLLVILAFVIGLSFTHHHAILFIVPSLLYWLWKDRIFRYLSGAFVYKVVGTFLIGLLPYMYLPIAGRGSAAVNWNRPETLDGFIKLITRAYYGTFTSSVGYGPYISQRILQIKTYLRFLILDMGVFGISLSIIGIYSLWRKDLQLGTFILLALFGIGPLFLFYASFPLNNTFALATFERFLLPSYFIISLFIGLGYAHSIQILVKYTKKVFSSSARTLLTTGFIVVLFIYSAFQVNGTLTKFKGFAQDQTAENLAKDFLGSVGKNSIVLLSSDTSLFPTQYMRYVLGFRPDVTVLHGWRISQPEYKKTISLLFSAIRFDSISNATKISEIIDANRDRFSIYTNDTTIPIKEGFVWVNHGILYKLEDVNAPISIEQIIETNERLWKTYHDPGSGVLQTYNHLMLADVKNVYANAKISYGKALLKADKYPEAQKAFEDALSYGGDMQKYEAYKYLGLAQLFSKNCEEAMKNFEISKKESLVKDVDIDYLEAVTIKDCLKDDVKAQYLYEKYRKEVESGKIPLKSL